MPKQAIDGKSLVPLLKGKQSIDQPVLYWHYPHYHGGGASPESAMREGNWKLIQFYNDNHVELYNLRTDVEERNDLAGLLPERAAKMLHQLNDWKRKTLARIPKLNPFYNPGYQKVINQDHESYQKYLKEYRSLFGKDTYRPTFVKKLSKKYHKKYPTLQQNQ